VGGPGYLDKPTLGEVDQSFIQQVFKRAREIESQVSLPENTILINGEITLQLTLQFYTEFEQLKSDSTVSEIFVFLKSNGGSWTNGRYISRLIANCPKPVEIRCCMALSAAAGILASGTKGRRFIYEGSYVMIHPSYSASPDSNSALSTPEETVSFFEASDWFTAEFLAEKTGQSVKRILKDQKKGKWFSADEAVEYGFADSVIVIPK
jgi:ATP-dependent Clp protease protease subunit